jgi:hypothetical protein
LNLIADPGPEHHPITGGMHMAKLGTTPKKKKRKGGTFLLILLAGTALSIVLHQFRHDPLMTLATKAKSVIVISGYFPVAAVVSLAAAFCIIGLIFLSIQKTMTGTKRLKGVLFGIALGGMYLVGMIEAYVVYPVSLFGEIYTGMVDGVGIFLMSLLLGRYMADDTPEGKSAAYPAFPAILIVPVVYVLVRYFSYTVLHIESTYVTRLPATFLWTAGMGCWCGIMYLLVGRGVRPGRPLVHALIFGGLVFGVNWVIFNLFALLFIKLPIADLLYRSVFDSLAVIVGVYVSSLLSRKPAPVKATRER